MIDRFQRGVKLAAGEKPFYLWCRKINFWLSTLALIRGLIMRRNKIDLQIYVQIPSTCTLLSRLIIVLLHWFVSLRIFVFCYLSIP